MESNSTHNPRKWLVLLAVGMSYMFPALDENLVTIAIPTLVREFNSEIAIMQWVIVVYFLTLAIFLVSMGRLGDMIGKKARPLWPGFAIFVVALLLSGTAQTPIWLILVRTLTGLGAALMLSVGAGILTEAFPPHERGLALGLLGVAIAGGIVIGPLVGGLVLSNLTWRWLFFLNVPVGLIGLWMAIRFVPDITPEGGASSFDFLGAALLGGGLLAFLLALTLGPAAWIWR